MTCENYMKFTLQCIKQALLEHSHAHLFTYSVAASAYGLQSLKYLLPGPLQKELCHP